MGMAGKKPLPISHDGCGGRGKDSGPREELCRGQLEAGCGTAPIQVPVSSLNKVNC